MNQPAGCFTAQEIEAAYGRGMRDAAQIANDMAASWSGRLLPLPDGVIAAGFEIMRAINTANPGSGFGQ